MENNSCCIIVKVKNEDIGRTIKFSQEVCPIDTWDNDYGTTVDDRTEPITLEHEYIGIYCNWDGDLEYVGADLKEGFNNYDKALNLVLGGHCSAINADIIRHYANRNHGTWEELSPIQGNTMKSVYEQIEYKFAYVFDDEKGWRYKTKDGKSFKSY